MVTNAYLNTSTPQHLNTSTPQHINIKTILINEQIKHPIGIAASRGQLGFRTEAFAKYEPDASGYEYAEKCEIGNSEEGGRLHHRCSVETARSRRLHQST
ncbi:MAG: hypothetical protein MR901_07490 [Prevotella sp.]|nr:hypothetical protein [Prevotella sp.]